MDSAYTPEGYGDLRSPYSIRQDAAPIFRLFALYLRDVVNNFRRFADTAVGVDHLAVD
jgi:hypothetical protein